METETISIEVVYALAEKQFLVCVDVQRGTTVAEAIELSGIKNEFPGIEIDPARLGIFSVKAKPEDVLRAGDRVEIYRPLLTDPKEARRKRALLEKTSEVP